MEAIANLERMRASEQRTFQLTATSDRHVQPRQALGDQCQRLQEIAVAFYRVQVADRDGQLIAVAEPQLLAQ